MESSFLDQSSSRMSFGNLYSIERVVIAAWKDSLYIPTAVALVSLVCLLVQAIIRLRSRTRDGDRPAVLTEEVAPPSSLQKFRRFEQAQGGGAVLIFKVARLLGCLTILGVSVAGLIFHRAGGPGDGKFSLYGPELGLAVTYWYAALLAITSLASKSWSTTGARHCNTILFTTWLIYLYRDIWPLVTYKLHPKDELSVLFWTSFSILGTTAVAIPLLIPRKYIPVDPKNPMPVPNPEQTASIMSLLFYFFMDPIIFEASKVAHLPHEKLPPLADYDNAEYLTKKNWPHLDPFEGAPRRHLFFNLLRVFRWEYTMMSVALAVQTIASFAPPLAVNRLLAYFETEGRDAAVSPWVWVAVLFCGPMLVSIFYQLYVFYGTRALARIDGLLVQLIFEHSLRIRLKAEAHSEGSSKNTTSATTPADTPKNTSLCGDTIDGDAESEATSPKGKATVEPPPSKLDSPPKNNNNLIGKINTLVAVDVNTIGESKDFLLIFIQVPLELVLSLGFLYQILGWSCLIGFASIILLMPIPGFLGPKLQKIVNIKMSKTDARVQAVAETTSMLRMIKLFGWERKISKQLQEKRSEELSWLWKEKLVQISLDIMNAFIPVVTMVLTYATYTVIMKQPLNASKVFSSTTVFHILKDLLYRVSWIFTMFAKGKVSLDRIGEFLRDTELLDCFDEDSRAHSTTFQSRAQKDAIGFSNAVFSWSKEGASGTLTPSSRQFRLRVDGTVIFKRNCINLVVGPTGSGKTSILMALLGEMHFIPPSIDSWYSLPRQGGIAYAAQESWVQNETIKDNILFGSPYDEERYKKVIYQCALERDLELFEAGDATEVGERGLTLSGGQKARVTLARALYSDAAILLLDDILAALDVHTSKWIVDKCLKGDLIRGRTVILVTHNIALTNPIAGFVVSVGKDGTVQAVGSDALIAVAADPELAHEIEREKDAVQLEKEVVDEVVVKEKKLDGKLTVAEEIVEGRVTWSAILLYVTSLSSHAMLFLAVFMSGRAFTHGADVAATWFLGYWGSQYDTHHPQEVPVFFYLSRYALILIASLTVVVAVQSFYYWGTLRASRVINNRLIDSVLGAKLRWLDETPSARILTRCTQDIAGIDGTIAWGFGVLIELVLSMVIRLAAPVFLSPIVLAPGILVTLLAIKLGNIYLKAQMSVRREQSNAKAPVLSHFGAAINGLVSIRAYGAQQPLKQESMKRISHYIKVARTSYTLGRWIAVRIDFLGACFTSGLAAYLLKSRNLSAANTGFSINMSITFCSTILFIVRIYNDFEVQCNSLERIQSYLNIEHEPPPTSEGLPPAAWPTSGDLVVENLSARYSSNGPRVLHDLSFTVRAGERIGIVGRTGSGKSSLTLALLRCILTEGEVRYDGIPTSTINLDALRSSITIIPQMPELLSGSLRRNLDPFEQCDDSALNDALRSAGLFTLQDETDEARLTLESTIASGGGNLSVGQRQILALARAIVRNSKLLILDEATSAIDHKTDTIIQTTLRHELPSDTTVLTVAHRLQSIMDADKVMVLDAGRIVEFDSPTELLRKKAGVFKAMVDESGDRKALYRMAENRASGSTLVS